MRELIKILVLLPLVLILLASNWSLAQYNEEELYEMSLEELMDVSIVSASKKQESLFEAPLASSTITKEEIAKSGATSIPEALRLSSDLIVREVTNGIYDVHVRGFDNVPRYTSGVFQTNQLTLVMIDDRPVFNHIMGVVYWEALPIDLVDVERIEIVKGPSAPLFGSNAVTGVINIITKELKDENLNIEGSYQTGTLSTHLGGVSVGYKNSDKYSIGVSGNFQMRDRYTEEYYEFASQSYKEKSELMDVNGMPLPEGAMSDHQNALNKKGINLFSNFNISDDINVGIEAGWQDATSQKYYFDNGYTPFTFFNSENSYVNFDSDIYGIKTRVSYSRGDDDMNQYESYLSYKYKFDVTEVFIDYTWDISERLSVQPGLNYFDANYKPYGDPSQISLFNEDKHLTTFAASLRFDYKPIENLRLIAGLRGDKFSHPDDFYFSYQFASTYKLNKNNLVRASISKSNSSAFIGPTFLDVQLEFPIPNTNQFGIYEFSGNENLQLFILQAYEVGFRSRIGDNLETSLDVYYQKGDNFYAVVMHEVPEEYFQFGSSVVKMENLPLTAHQYGATASVNWVMNANIQVKPFITYQFTQAEDVPEALNTEAYNPAANLNTTVDDEHETTPNFYGGAFLNYNEGKFNINLNSYFTYAYTIYHTTIDANDNETGRVNGIFNVNAKASYKVFDQLSVFVNGKNLTGSDKAQMYGTDPIGAQVLGGISFHL